MRRSNSYVGLWAALFLLLTGPISEAAEPWQLLERANHALRQTSFTGTFMRMPRPGHPPPIMKIFQRFDGDNVQQRMLSVYGEPFEIVRNGTESTWVYPGRKLVFHRHGHAIPMMHGLPKDPAQVAGHYQVETAGLEYIAERNCEVVRIIPRDQFRYGFELCIDQESGLPLRARLQTLNRESANHYEFIQLQVFKPGQTMDPEMVQLQTRTRGFRRVSMPSKRPAPRPSTVKWTLPQMPPGFAVQKITQRRHPHHAESITHVRVSDSLTHVSIFIMRSTDELEVPKPKSSLHATYRSIRNGHQVFVFGSAPLRTLQMIGDTIEVH